MKKLLLCATLTMALTSSLVACGGKSDDFKPSMDKNTSCSIKVVGTYDNFEALDAVIAKFNKIYPKVEIDYEKPDEYTKILPTALSGNDRPNIFFAEAKWIGNESFASIVSHMEDLSDPSLNINIDCIRPGLIKRDASNKVPMAPVFSRTYGALVNNDLFKKEKLKVPETWNDLLSVCKSFLDKGYTNPMMGYTAKADPSNIFMNVVAYPAFLATLSKDPQALALANSLDKSAGQYMRDALTAVDELVKNKCVDISECNKIEDNYKKLILRFFEGDIPMMLCNGDTVAGTKKRETESEAYAKSKFSYSFYPIPVNAQGSYFIDSPSLQLAVNKDCANLDMTNEFMRFVISDSSLNEMASIKRLTTSSKKIFFDSVYAPFGKIPAERTISPEVLGIGDSLFKQIRVASYKVGKNELSIDEAIAQFGDF